MLLIGPCLGLVALAILSLEIDLTPGKILAMLVPGLLCVFELLFASMVAKAG